MNQFETQKTESKFFLGVDGGQSHTEAVVSDETGSILGRGLGGASNHAEQPGGRERLRNAILKSVGQALEKAHLSSLEETTFASAYFGMTGGADFKEEIIGEIVKANNFTVSHDAQTALFGSTAGKPGVVVIAGTGSIVYGENELGEITKIGGLGYLFSDEGSGFWLALQTIKLAIKEQDGLIPSAGLEKLVLDFFQRQKLRELTNDFYYGKLSRDELASFAKIAHEAAANGNGVIEEQIKFGASVLAESVRSAARRLGLQENFPVAGVGGMFRGELMKKHFTRFLQRVLYAVFVEPRFNPAIGALLLAYKQANVEITESLLENLEKFRN